MQVKKTISTRNRPNFLSFRIPLPFKSPLELRRTARKEKLARGGSPLSETSSPRRRERAYRVVRERAPTQE